MKTIDEILDEWYATIPDEEHNGLYARDKVKLIAQEFADQFRQPAVSSSCSCGIPYVETKKSDIPYDTDDNVYYTDILIHHCPKCGNIDRIDEY